VLVRGKYGDQGAPYIPSPVTRYIAPPVLSVDVNAGEQGHQVGDLDVLE
jgi:hypothetical protein